MSYIHQYYPSGYLVFQEGGDAGKVCADHMNRTVPREEVGRVLEKLGQSMCAMLEYKELGNIRIQEDEEEGNRDIRYVDMVGPMSAGSKRDGGRSFVEVPCAKRQVLKVSCAGGLACGRRPAHVPSEERSREPGFVGASGAAPALHGDWPWHAALYKNGQHVCDGALIGEDWLMTTRSCFQGQGRSRWVARFASVRLGSRAPWEQRRRVVGMVKAPVEGSSLVLLKLDRAVELSDFARPVCLPSSDEFVHLGAPCVTLGWDAREEGLRAVHLGPAARETCEEESEVPANTICTQEKADSKTCYVSRPICRRHL